VAEARRVAQEWPAAEDLSNHGAANIHAPHHTAERDLGRLPLRFPRALRSSMSSSFSKSRLVARSRGDPALPPPPWRLVEPSGRHPGPFPRPARVVALRVAGVLGQGLHIAAPGAGWLASPRCGFLAQQLLSQKFLPAAAARFTRFAALGGAAPLSLWRPPCALWPPQQPRVSRAGQEAWQPPLGARAPRHRPRCHPWVPCH
jgi:hypothetical protein